VAVQAETVGRLVLDTCNVDGSSELSSGPKECFKTVAVRSCLLKDETYRNLLSSFLPLTQPTVLDLKTSPKLY